MASLGSFNHPEHSQQQSQEHSQEHSQEKPQEKPQKKYNKTNSEKWLCALGVTILFLVVSMPATYKLTNMLFKGVCVLASKNGCPTMCGILVHALVFLLLVRLSYELNTLQEGMKYQKKTM